MTGKTTIKDLEAGANIDCSQADNKMSPLALAAFNSDLDLVKLLASQSQDHIDDTGDEITVFNIAARSSNPSIELLDYLLEEGADINTCMGGDTPLMGAISTENLEIVKYLIKKGAQIRGMTNDDGEDTLAVAERIGNKHIIDYLNSQFSNVTLKDLEDAVDNQDIDLLRQLLPNFKGNIHGRMSSNTSLLHYVATIEGSEQFIHELVEYGMDINTLDSYGVTPLHESVVYQCPNNCKKFLELGADPILSHTDNDATPLTAAAFNNDLTIVKLLIEHGVGVDDSRSRLTALNVAAELDNPIELLDYLLGQGADINSGDGYGTPLMAAISGENIEVIKYLVEKGAKIEGLTDINGDNALEFAERVENQEIIDYLKSQL